MKILTGRQEQTGFNIESMLEGDLKNLPLNDVLQVLATGRKTGVLTLAKDAVQAHLYLDRGRLEHAHLVPGLHLGELLVRMDLLTTFEVQTLLARQTRAEPGVGLGLLAVEAELIEPGELIAALKAQVLEVMTELATWRSGSSVFGERPLSASRLPGGHGFDMTLLLMEVLGRLELWQQGSVEPGSVFERVRPYAGEFAAEQLGSSRLCRRQTLGPFYRRGT